MKKTFEPTRCPHCQSTTYAYTDKEHEITYQHGSGYYETRVYMNVCLDCGALFISKDECERIKERTLGSGGYPYPGQHKD